MPTREYQLYVCIHTALLPIDHPFMTIEEAQSYINYMYEKTKDIKYALVHIPTNTHTILTPTTYIPCYITYIVHSDVVYEESEWYEDPSNERYDDIIKCNVDISHPSYNEDTFYSDMERMWSMGVTPSYVQRA